MRSAAEVAKACINDCNHSMRGACISCVGRTLVYYAAQARAEALKKILDVVSEQAADEGLWFIAQYGSEAYLQQELRRLHAAIEAPAPDSHYHSSTGGGE